MGVACFYLLDLAIKIKGIGLADFFTRGRDRDVTSVAQGEPWDFVRVLLITLLLADIALALALGLRYRFFRMLRPLILISYARELRRWMQITAKILPQVLEMFLFVGVVIVMYARRPICIFRMRRPLGMWPPRARYAVIGVLLFAPTGLYTGQFGQDFASFGWSLVNVYVLFGGSQNYPSEHSRAARVPAAAARGAVEARASWVLPLPPPLCDCAGCLTSGARAAIMYYSYSSDPPSSTAYAVYFISYILVAMFCLGHLIVPILFRAFRGHRREMAIRMHIDERRSLLAAFKCLDTADAGCARSAVRA